MDQRFLSQPEICRAIGISKATLYRWIGKGLFPPPTKIGGRALWHITKFEAWVATVENVES